MAIGTSGNQFKNAPVVGHLMAELIDQVQNGHDHDADPVKVKSVYTGVELDAGFYSRLREVNPARASRSTGSPREGVGGRETSRIGTFHVHPPVAGRAQSPSSARRRTTNSSSSARTASSIGGCS